jgi:hypothetical protein
MGAGDEVVLDHVHPAVSADHLADALDDVCGQGRN